MVDIGSIVQVVDSSNPQYAIGKLSQYMFRQALVTQQLRNGTDTYYDGVSVLLGLKSWGRAQNPSLKHFHYSSHL